LIGVLSTPAMSIAFESDEAQLQKLRECLRQMTDDELIRFGKTVRRVSGARAGPVPKSVADSIRSRPRRMAQASLIGPIICIICVVRPRHLSAHEKTQRSLSNNLLISASATPPFAKMARIAVSRPYWVSENTLCLFAFCQDQCRSVQNTAAYLFRLSAGL
jgi:hypothetical protein